MQLEYSLDPLGKRKLERIVKRSDLEKEDDKDINVERDLFYSLIASLAANDSRLINAFLKKLSAEYKSNNELLNPSKIDLYNKYKYYLSRIEKDKDLKNELESPLKPNNVSKMTEVKEILDTPMYINTGNVKLFKQGKHFYWKIFLDKLEARFTLTRHELQEMNILSPQGMIEVLAYNHKTYFDGRILPGKIVIKNVLEELFEVSLLGFRYFGSESTDFQDVSQRYKLSELKPEGSDRTLDLLY